MYVLVVDDDPDILSTVVDHLELQGIIADCASSGQQALGLTERNRYDVIVLDVMMPGLDGLSTCRALRQQGSTVPILFLTARDTLDDKIDGFDAGGDDYLVKPFHMRELASRVKALSQRISHQGAQRLCFGELSLDLERHDASRGSLRLSLSPVQFAILKSLIHRAPSVVKREQLEREVWQDHPPDSDALRTHIYQLRSILDKPFSFKMLRTVRGQGFQLVKNEQTDEHS